YFRIGVLPVYVPPLRERLDDLEILLAHFLGEDAKLSPDLVARLRERPWNGNVRELRNFVDRMRALGHDRALAMTDVHAPALVSTQPEKIAEPPSAPPAVPEQGLDVPPHLTTGESFRAFRERWTEQ